MTKHLELKDFDDPPGPIGRSTPSELRNRNHGFRIPPQARDRARDEDVRVSECRIFRMIELNGDEFLAIGHHWFGIERAPTLRLEDLSSEQKERMLQGVQETLDRMRVNEKKGLVRKMLDDMCQLWDMYREDDMYYDRRYTAEDVEKWESENA